MYHACYVYLDKCELVLMASILISLYAMLTNYSLISLITDSCCYAYCVWPVGIDNGLQSKISQSRQRRAGTCETIRGPPIIVIIT